MKQNTEPGQMEEQPLQETRDWRDWFPQRVVKQGEQLLRDGMLKDFVSDERTARAVLAKGSTDYHVVISKAPTAFEENWNGKSFQCSCTRRDRVYKDPCQGWRGGYYFVCSHAAAVMLHWEEEHGPWTFTESREAFEARRERERLLERQERERIRRKKLRKKLEEEIIPAEDFFQASGTGFFDVRRAMEGAKMKSNRYAFLRAEELRDSGCGTMEPPKLSYGKTGEQNLHAGILWEDEVERCRTTVTLSFTTLEDRSCSCHGYWGYSLPSFLPVCEHELALLALLQNYIDRENPGDATDQAAERFFSALEGARPPQEEQKTAAAAERERNLTLSPRITADNGAVTLSFKLSAGGGKGLLLRGLPAFTAAVQGEETFALSKTQTVDFSKNWFTEESLPWLTFIQRRVSEMNGVNDRLQSRNGYVRALTVQAQDDLTGANLDRFYELAEGGTFEFQDKGTKATGLIRVGHAPMRVHLASAPIRDRSGALLGITVTGDMPVILRGSAGSYILGTGSLSRITREEEQALLPFRSAADAGGKIRFRVGKEKLAEFYYRAAPSLLDSPYVDFEDTCGEEAAPLLPPEPSFRFRLDIENDRCLCAAQVDYGPGFENLQDERSGYRDAAQEQRVERVLNGLFPKFSPKKGWWAPAEDDFLYRLLTEGLPELHRYGEVLGSDAFNRGSLRPMPQLRVGVSLESGLLEIDVLSRDLSPEELLGILESYQTKKRYHRLRSGEFVTLGEDGQLDALTALSDGMGLDAEQLLSGPVRLPMYRALYLDSMLEAHDALAAGRDRTYRSLIKNFHTIRDADYEVPADQAEILRPYQLYGYKWLRTLAAAGFGGILADEMGLGKTLQTIALIQALKDEGETAPALVVCPASLVYNWQEEVRRFAPRLKAEPVGGTAGARKKLLEAVRDPEQAPDVLITSYDLLRKDITAYESLHFSLMVLDEAQYIKNQKAGMTKAVKVVGADRRFALTGTPIENRLAELWSIFDFLMPGFLYGYTEFSRRFETPIVKNRDGEATERLKRMVAPFILRRLKADVLKDLPPKLEEVRYTRFGEEQRKIYDGQVVRIRQTLSGLGNSGEDKLRVLAELTRIRQICCDPSLLFEDYDGGSAKRAACLELLESAISGGHRCLLFSQFTSMLALLEEDLNREGIPYCKIVGATPKEQRVRLVREFNEGDTPVFLISLKAGGTGLNLTGADVVIHYDPWWNLAAQNQATDRAHRIGQSRTVTVYRIIVKDTIEEKILELQNAKRDLAEAVLTGENASLSSLSTEELLSLLG